MKTIGEMLHSLREKQGKSVAEITSRTQIKKQYIEAIENSEYGELPSVLAAQGFIVLYAKVVGMSESTALALLRRDFDIRNDQIVPKLENLDSTRHLQRRAHTIRTLFFLLIGVVVIAGYGIWGWWKLHSPPTLVITSPTDQSAVRSPVVIRGHADSDSIVEVDSSPVALDQNGDFAYQLALSGGEHTISVIAQSRKGQQTVVQRTIRVQ